MIHIYLYYTHYKHTAIYSHTHRHTLKETFKKREFTRRKMCRNILNYETHYLGSGIGPQVYTNTTSITTMY